MNSVTRFTVGVLCATLVGLASEAGSTQDFPAPPKGYEWYVFDAGKSAYLRPDGWFVKTEEKAGTAAIFISKEDISERGFFETGLTVNVVNGIKAKVGAAASEYAAAYMSKLVSSMEVAKQFSTPAQSGMSGLGARYRDSTRSPTMLVHVFLLADDEGDILRIMTFEAPEREWADAWIHGERMLKGQAWR